MKLLYRVTFLTEIAVILLLCSTSAPLFAQASTGAVAQITGSVSDSTGAVVPDAQVTATQTETGFTRTAVTGVDGTYVLPNLIVGPYQLQVVRSGFKTYVQKGIVLEVNDNATVAVELQVGATMRASLSMQMPRWSTTESSSVSSVIENRRVVDLPLNGRDLSQLVLLSGAAVQTNYGDSISSKNYPTSHTIQVAGGEAAGTGYMVDGGGAYNDLYGGSNLPLPFPDAVQEFSVQTSMIPAQYGGFPGGAVNIVTMSGTNNFHGVLFEFIRNYAVNAANYFATTRRFAETQPIWRHDRRTDSKEQAFLFWRISGDDHAHRSTYQHFLCPYGSRPQRGFQYARVIHVHQQTNHPDQPRGWDVSRKPN